MIDAVDRQAARPPLDHPRAGMAPTASRSRSVAKTSSGSSARSLARNASSTSVHDETSTANWAPYDRAREAAATAVSASGGRNNE